MKNKFSNIYFIGIGGIGMSAIARYYKVCGYNVAGYDRTRTEICTNLEKEGISIHYEDNLNFVGTYYKDPEKTLVIFTPAIHADNVELSFFVKNGFKVIKRAEALGHICEGKNCLAVSGTHGKTSISTIATCIMSQTDEKCSAFLGGISKNFMSNFRLIPESHNVVVEADEFDRSFLELTPSSAVISCVEADHLDIYGDYETLESAFVEFGNRIVPKGNLILSSKVSLETRAKFKKGINLYTYGIENQDCDFYATNINYKKGLCVFDIVSPFGKISDINFKIGGAHNIENAVAASAISLLNKASLLDVKKGLELFNGVLRRFDIRLQNEKCTYIDDYAHHPSEISAFLKAVKVIYPQKKITAIFQPHLYSRTNDFYVQFAESLSVCDNLILLPIYPARELPIEGVTSKLIYDICTSPNKFLCEKDKLLDLLKDLDTELVLTMGAGDIDRFVKPITEMLSIK